MVFSLSTVQMLDSPHVGLGSVQFFYSGIFYIIKNRICLLTRRGTASKSSKFSGPSITISLDAHLILRSTVLSFLCSSVMGTLVPIMAFKTSSSICNWVAKFCRVIISWSNFARTIVLSCKAHHMLEICSNSGYTKK